MPARSGPPRSDEDLDRLARQWFDDVRAQHPDRPTSKDDGDAAGEVGAGLLDWLCGDGDGDDAGDDVGGD